MPESTLNHSIPYPSPDDEVRGSTADYLQTDLRDLALGTDAAITSAVGTRAPLSHTHTQAQIDGLPAALTSAGETAQWGSVSGKPSAYPPTEHTHHRLDNPHGHVTLDASGGVQHSVGGTRRWWVDANGTLREGTVPTERVIGLADSLAALEYFSGVRDITSAATNITEGSVRLWRIGTTCTMVLSAVSNPSITGTGLTNVYALPVAFRPPSQIVQQLDPGNAARRWDITPGGSFRVDAATLKEPLNLTITWSTTQAPPPAGSLPGTPA